MSTEKKPNDREIKIDDLISVPIGDSFLKGIVSAIEKNTYKISTYNNGTIEIPKSDNVYKMNKGQKFDFRELLLKDNSDDATKDITILDKINAFLSKTNIGNYQNLELKDKLQLLSGKLTHTMFEGQSLIPKQNEPDTKVLANWKVKLQLYKGKNGKLKLDPKFQQDELKYSVYGKPLTDAEKKDIDNKKTIIIKRKNKEGVEYKVFARLDKDLNTIVTSPYSKKIEERIVASQAKKESESKSKSKTKKKSNSVS